MTSKHSSSDPTFNQNYLNGGPVVDRMAGPIPVVVGSREPEPEDLEAEAESKKETRKE